DPLQLGLDPVALVVQLAPARRDLLHRRDLRRGVLAPPLGLADRLGGGVLALAQRLELRQDGPPALVELEHPVQRSVGPAARQRGPHRLGFAAEGPRVEEAYPPAAGAGGGDFGFLAWVPA